MRVRFSIGNRLSSLIEIVGIKSGIAVSEEYARRVLSGAYDYMEEHSGHAIERWYDLPADLEHSVRAELIEADFLILMHSLGSIPDHAGPTDLVVHWLHQRNPIDTSDMQAVRRRCTEVSALLMRIVRDEDVPPEAADLAQEVRRRFILDRSLPQQRKWNGLISLAALFESEDIPDATEPSAHFDQRFIDYLAVQPDAIEGIHWRQFEYLCGEYFRRNGYAVSVTLSANMSETPILPEFSVRG